MLSFQWLVWLLTNLKSLLMQPEVVRRPTHRRRRCIIGHKRWRIRRQYPIAAILCRFRHHFSNRFPTAAVALTTSLLRLRLADYLLVVLCWLYHRIFRGQMLDWIEALHVAVVSSSESLHPEGIYGFYMWPNTDHFGVLWKLATVRNLGSMCFWFFKVSFRQKQSVV